MPPGELRGTQGAGSPGSPRASLAFHCSGSPANSRDGPQQLSLQTDQGTQTSSLHRPPGRQDPSPGPQGSAHKLLTKAASSPVALPPRLAPTSLSPPPSLSSAGQRSTNASRIPRSRDVWHRLWLQPEACLLAEPSLCPFPLGVPSLSPLRWVLQCVHLPSVPLPEHLRLGGGLCL